MDECVKITKVDNYLHKRGFSTSSNWYFSHFRDPISRTLKILICFSMERSARQEHSISKTKQYWCLFSFLTVHYSMYYLLHFDKHSDLCFEVPICISLRQSFYICWMECGPKKETRSRASTLGKEKQLVSSEWADKILIFE